MAPLKAFLPLILLAARLTADAAPDSMRTATQCLVVLTPGWDAVSAEVFLCQRDTVSSEWKQHAGPLRAVVGAKGLAWGRGLVVPEPAGGEPRKREGDQRAPAGIFALGPAFGRANSLPAPHHNLDYRPLTAGTEAVDDPRSRYYNQIVNRSAVSQPDWESSERMDGEPLYRWGLVVRYNTGPAVPGAGSCIFLHLWRGPGQGTAGCTALAESDLLSILTWLDPSRHPCLVQLPRSIYTAQQTVWSLPLVK